METLSVQLIKIDNYVDRTDSKNRSALWYSADLGLSKVTTALIKSKQMSVNLADTNGYTALASAVSGGHLNISKFLIRSGASVKTLTGEKNTILMLSVLSKNQNLTKYLLTRNVDISAKNIAGDTALMLAAASGLQETVNSLIRAGANPQTRNLDDQNAYQIAIDSGHIQTGNLIKENSNIVFKLFN